MKLTELLVDQSQHTDKKVEPLQQHIFLLQKCINKKNNTRNIYSPVSGWKKLANEECKTGTTLKWENTINKKITIKSKFFGYYMSKQWIWKAIKTNLEWRCV